MTKKNILSAVALLVVGFIAGVYGSKVGVNLGGASYDPSYLVGDVYQGLSQQLAFRDGVMRAPASSTGNAAFGSLSIAGGSSTTVSNCTSTTWNPGVISSSSVATTTITGIAGLTFNTFVDLSLGTSTVSSTQGISALLTGYPHVVGASTGTIYAQLSWPTAGQAGVWDIATTTLRACYRVQ